MGTVWQIVTRHKPMTHEAVMTSLQHTNETRFAGYFGIEGVAPTDSGLGHYHVFDSQRTMLPTVFYLFRKSRRLVEGKIGMSRVQRYIAEVFHRQLALDLGARRGADMADERWDPEDARESFEAFLWHETGLAVWSIATKSASALWDEWFSYPIPFGPEPPPTFGLSRPSVT